MRFNLSVVLRHKDKEFTKTISSKSFQLATEDGIIKRFLVAPIYKIRKKIEMSYLEGNLLDRYEMRPRNFRNFVRTCTNLTLNAIFFGTSCIYQISSH